MLFPVDTQPKAEEIETMSSHLKELEYIRNPSPSILKLLYDSRIFKVLKKIIKQPEILKDDEFDFKKQSIKLLENWKETEDLTTSLNKKSIECLIDLTEPINNPSIEPGIAKRVLSVQKVQASDSAKSNIRKRKRFNTEIASNYYKI